jgi:hypothetical protein
VDNWKWDAVVIAKHGMQSHWIRVASLAFVENAGDFGS